MKRYLILILLGVLVPTSGLLAGCAQEATLPPAQTELESRITSLETKLTATESTIKVLQQRIEQLEKTPQKSLTEADILRTLQGKEFWASVGGRYMKIWFGECTSLRD